MSFSHIEGEMFLVVLYRNNELRLWSVSTLHNIATLSCAETQGVQGRKLEFSRHCIRSNYCDKVQAMFLSKLVSPFVSMKNLSRIFTISIKHLAVINISRSSSQIVPCLINFEQNWSTMYVYHCKISVSWYITVLCKRKVLMIFFYSSTK